MWTLQILGTAMFVEYKDESCASGCGGIGISLKGTERPFGELGIPERKVCTAQFYTNCVSPDNNNDNNNNNSNNNNNNNNNNSNNNNNNNSNNNNNNNG